jgi:hypothetical protein
LAWRGVEAPAQLKFFAPSGSAACALCYGLAGLLLRAPAIWHVL